MKISVGLQIQPNPPLTLARTSMRLARVFGLESVVVADHFQGLLPSSIWDADFTWAAKYFGSPHELFDFQVLLGYLARDAGRLRLGVGVTEAIRRHPVLIAQAMLTLAHMVKRAPILGIGAGERENVEPYGLDFSAPVGRLEEALQILRLCFSRTGPLDFQGTYFRLDRALLDLTAPEGRTPEVWVAAHGPRMLRLAGRYGDGWYPTVIASPEEYAAKLAVIRAAAAEAGRDPNAIVPSLHQYVVVAPSERAARAMLDTRQGRYAALMLATAEEWRAIGAVHPLGEGFRGYVDFLPENYDRPTFDRALAAVPRELLGHGLLVGTPMQVANQLRAFGAAGLRHVILDPASALASRRDALYSFWAIGSIARALREGRE